MSLASKTPTQMGRRRCPSWSRRMMMGMLVIGSIMRPLIVISICMGFSAPPAPSQYSPRGNLCNGIIYGRCRPADKGVGSTAGDLHRNEPAEKVRSAVEVDDPEMTCSSRDSTLAADGIDQDLLVPAHPTCVERALPALLAIVQHVEPAALLFVRHVVRLTHRGRSGPRRVVEDEEPIEADLVHEGDGVLEVRLRL